MRECNKPVPLNGGLFCLGSHNEIRACSGINHLFTKYFHANHTQLLSVNGGWSLWGSWNCDKNTGQQRRDRQCDNPTPRNDGISCSGSSIEKIDCKGSFDTDSIEL